MRENERHEWNEKKRDTMARMRETRQMQEAMQARHLFYNAVEPGCIKLSPAYQSCDAYLLLDDFLL